MYRVGVSREFLNSEGDFSWGDIGLGAIERQRDMAWQMVASGEPLDDPQSIESFDALLVLRQRVDDTLLASLPRLRHVSRWGAGLERIDLDACTCHGVIVTSTPHGGRRPVAAAALALALALTHQVLPKDRLVREGRWAERWRYMGMGLTGKIVGIIGLGHIGREFAHLVATFDPRLVSFSPHADASAAATANVALVDLPTLMRTSDLVVVTCALNDRTRGMLAAPELGLMKPTAYLVNVARGEVIDETALVDALRQHRIAGAALDVFHAEPLSGDHPLTRLDNVILTPHAVAWTDEIVAGNAVDAIGSIVDVAAGRAPRFVANPQVLQHHRWKALAA